MAVVNPDSIETGDHHVQCTLPNCNRTWEHEDLGRIARAVANHWNEEHGDELQHGYTAFDTVERGGHHLHNNEYTVERVSLYITSFDVMERIGYEDGYAMAADDETVCPECLREIPNEEDRIEVDDGGYYKEWECAKCIREAELERRREQNQQLTTFVTEP